MVIYQQKKLKKIKKQFKSKLNKITTGNPKHKSKDQLDTIKNIKKSVKLKRQSYEVI